MVAKINRGASLYGAVIYNQQKVDDSTARIISGNRMIADVTGNPEQVMRNTLWAFENWFGGSFYHFVIKFFLRLLCFPILGYEFGN